MLSDEEKAEEYADACRGKIKDIHWQDVKYAVLYGLAEGRKEKWHDLRKNPDDLPIRSKKIIDLSIPVLLSNKTISYYSYEAKEWRCVENGRKQSLITAWCELPEFKG